MPCSDIPRRRECVAKAGRPTLYSPEIADAILERLANGESMVQICSDAKMPGLRTVMRWAVDNDDFGTEYARAREAQAEVMDDKILTAAETAKADPQAARVQIEAYKWRAAKLAPKRFGDRIDVTSGGEKIEPDEITRATRLAAIFSELDKRNAPDESS
jgi:hypothetical protein